MRNFLSLILIVLFLAPAPARAQTAIDLPAPGAPHTHLYMLSRPKQVDSHLGAWERAAHLVAVEAFALYPAYLAFRWKGLLVGSGVGIYHGLKYLLLLNATTPMHLKMREKKQWNRIFDEIAQFPTVAESLVLTSNNLDFKGTMATDLKRQGYIFVRTLAPLQLTPEMEKEWGQAIEIRDPAQTFVNVTLTINGQNHPETWTMSLKDIFEGKAMSPETFTHWKVAVKAFMDTRTIAEKYWDQDKDRKVVMKGELVLPDGSIRTMDPLLSGQSAYRILGLARFQPTAQKFKKITGGKTDAGVKKLPVENRVFPCGRILETLSLLASIRS